MGVHIFVLMFVTAAALFIYDKSNKKRIRNRNKLFIIICEICFIFVIGLRASSVGLDTSVYERYFYAISNNPDYVSRIRWEPLFVLIIRIGILCNSFQVVLVITAVITCVGFGYFAYENTDKDASVYWFMLFYITLNLYFNSMHLIRQICAMAFCTNIYTVLNKERTRKAFLKAFILFLIGLGFHITALFSVIIFIPFITKTPSRRVFFYVTAGSIAGIIALPYLQDFLLTHISRYSVYVGDDRLTSGGTGVFAISIMLIKTIMVIYTLGFDPEEPENKDIYNLACINIVSIAFYILQFRTQFALRLGYYYEIFMPMFIAKFIRKLKPSQTRIIVYILMALYGIFYFIYMMKWGGRKSNRGTVPYNFYWQV